MAEEKRKLVALVTTDTFTPYKRNEIFCVPEEDAQKLLKVDKTRNDYGVARYPKVKVRLFDPRVDSELLLENRSLNLEDHNRLLMKLHPDQEPITVRLPQYRSEISDMLDTLKGAEETTTNKDPEENADNTGEDREPAVVGDAPRRRQRNT